VAFSLVTGQSAQGQGSGVATLSAVLPNNPAAGNLVVAIFCCSTGITATVKDGNNNSYTATTKTPFTGNSNEVGMFYLLSAPANASKTITASFSPNVSADFFVAEFSPGGQSAAFENDATATSAGTANIALPTYTTLNNGDLMVAGCTVSGTLTGAGAPWTGWAGGVPTFGNYAEFFIQTTAGAQAVAYTNANTAFAGIVAAFKLVTTDVLSPQIWM
jgi:hypothetical protein